MISSRNSLNELSAYYLEISHRIRAGQLSPDRGLTLLLQEIKQLSHVYFPQHGHHWQRAELKKQLRELLWTLTDADPDIWRPEHFNRSELRRFQARREFFSRPQSWGCRT